MVVGGSFIAIGCCIVGQGVLQDVSNLVFINDNEMLFSSKLLMFVPEDILVLHSSFFDRLV